MNEDKRTYNLKISLISLIGILIFFLSFFIGRFSVDPVTVVNIFLSRIFNISKTWTDAQYSVVMNIRLPRVACACLIGSALSVSGCAYQGMFRNPMASPDILGSSAGAAFGASLAILLGCSYAKITLLAFVFGLIAVFIAYGVSKVSKIQKTLSLVLAGVMISSLFQSGTSFVKLIADKENQLPSITYWLMGSLSSVKNMDFWFAFVPIAIGFIPLLLFRWRINLLTVSESESQSMGIETAKLRVCIIVCATLMTSASVAICGLIGWVGLIIPHFARLIFGDNYRHLIPSSAILGAAFLMLVDDIARVATTNEIPLGILTAFIGAPVFIYLIITGGTKREA